MIQSVQRAFALLKVIAENPNSMSMSEMAQTLNVHKSTVSRLIASLEAEGAVSRAENRSYFNIGNGILTLSPTRNHHIKLIAELKPLLQWLAKQTGETVGLSVPHGDCSVTLYQVQGEFARGEYDWTGDQFPLHVSSTGKHFLAHAGGIRLSEYLAKPLIRYTDLTVTDPSALKTRLHMVRAQNYDWIEGEFEDKLVSVSTPIMDRDNGLIAAIYVHGPSCRFTNTNRAKIQTLLLEACHQ